MMGGFAFQNPRMGDRHGAAFQSSPWHSWEKQKEEWMIRSWTEIFPSLILSFHFLLQWKWKEVCNTWKDLLFCTGKSLSIFMAFGWFGIRSKPREVREYVFSVPEHILISCCKAWDHDCSIWPIFVFYVEACALPTALVWTCVERNPVVQELGLFDTTWHSYQTFLLALV